MGPEFLEFKFCVYICFYESHLFNPNQFFPAFSQQDAGSVLIKLGSKSLGKRPVGFVIIYF